MARVTVEDCTKIIKNRFQLSVLAAFRARDIIDGALITVERDNDKNSIIALREIAENKLNIAALEHGIIHGRQARPNLNNETDNNDEYINEIHEDLSVYYNVNDATDNLEENILTEEFSDIAFDDLED